MKVDRKWFIIGIAAVCFGAITSIGQQKQSAIRNPQSAIKRIIPSNPCLSPPSISTTSSGRRASRSIGR